MLNKILSIVIIAGLAVTTNLSVLAQSQSSEAKSSRSAEASFKKEAPFKFGVSPAERAGHLLDKNYLTTVKAEGVSSKAMQDADNASQKRKFAGIGKTTAILIGAGIAAAIIIVLATRGRDNNNTSCGSTQVIGAPCPPGCVCIQ